METTLDRAALELARIEYPGLDSEPWVAVLDRLAVEVNALTGSQAPPSRFLEAMNQVLFLRFGLFGNEREYYDIRNSCLNEVLARRLGIPITLSVVYLEVARRLGREVYGIGLPAHFIVRYGSGAGAVYLDPFHAGETLDREECVRLVVEKTGAPPLESSFEPRTPEQILTRMMQNMKGIYVQAQAWEKALAVFARLLESGDNAAEFRQRGAVLVAMKRYRDGAADLRRYLDAVPEAPDREEVRAQVSSIYRYLAALN